MAGSSSGKGASPNPSPNPKTKASAEPGHLRKKYQNNAVDQEKPSMRISLLSLGAGVAQIPCNDNVLKAEVENYVRGKICFECQALLNEDKVEHMLERHRVKHSCPRCHEPLKKVTDLGKAHKLEISEGLSKKIGDFLSGLEEGGSDAESEE